MQKLFNALRGELMSRFPERANVIDGSLAAVLAGEHVLLLGPPGTAKSALGRLEFHELRTLAKLIVAGDGY